MTDEPKVEEPKKTSVPQGEANEVYVGTVPQALAARHVAANTMQRVCDRLLDDAEERAFHSGLVCGDLRAKVWRDTRDFLKLPVDVDDPDDDSPCYRVDGATGNVFVRPAEPEPKIPSLDELMAKMGIKQ